VSNKLFHLALSLELSSVISLDSSPEFNPQTPVEFHVIYLKSSLSPLKHCIQLILVSNKQTRDPKTQAL
jgi:hypothetical protein